MGASSTMSEALFNFAMKRQAQNTVFVENWKALGTKMSQKWHRYLSFRQN